MISAPPARSRVVYADRFAALALRRDVAEDDLTVALEAFELFVGDV